MVKKKVENKKEKKNVKKKENKKVLSKKKKIIIIISAIVLTIIVLGTIIFALAQNSLKRPGRKIPIFTKKEELPIKKSETKDIELDTFSNDVFSMKIPSGWNVSVMGSDIHYGIRVYNPKDSRYQMFAYLKMEPFMKSEAATNLMRSFYNLSKDPQYGMFSTATVLSSQSTEGFYKSFMYHITYMRSNYGKLYYGDVSNHAFPELYNIKILDSINPKINGGGQNEKILRMNFSVYGDNDKELSGQGLFSASVMPATPYMISGVDVMPVLVYAVMGISSAEDDFTSWEPVLMKCLNTLKYTDQFVSNTQKKSIDDAQAAKKANDTIKSAYDSYNSAWSARQTTYDVASQKRSDATLSYDRVKNPDTGEIYRAEVGWYDSYNTNRENYNYSNLELVTSDSDYLEPISGYIYK